MNILSCMILQIAMTLTLIGNFYKCIIFKNVSKDNTRYNIYLMIYIFDMFDFTS